MCAILRHGSPRHSRKTSRPATTHGGSRRARTRSDRKVCSWIRCGRPENQQDQQLRLSETRTHRGGHQMPDGSLTRTQPIPRTTRTLRTTGGHSRWKEVGQNPSDRENAPTKAPPVPPVKAALSCRQTPPLAEKSSPQTSKPRLVLAGVGNAVSPRRHLSVHDRSTMPSRREGATY